VQSIFEEMQKNQEREIKEKRKILQKQMDKLGALNGVKPQTL
jgi:hypothetical protein